jgi:hypothetical protein
MSLGLPGIINNSNKASITDISVLQPTNYGLIDSIGYAIDTPRSICIDSSENIYVLGNINNSSLYGFINAQTTASTQMFFVKYDSSFNIILYGSISPNVTNSISSASSICIDSSRNIYIAGTINQSTSSTVTMRGCLSGNSNIDLTINRRFNARNTSIFLGKYDMSGRPQWGKIIDSSGANYDYTKSMIIDNSNNICMLSTIYAGSIIDFSDILINRPNPTKRCLIISKFNPNNGNTIWAKNIELTTTQTPGSAFGISIDYDNFNNLYISADAPINITGTLNIDLCGLTITNNKTNAQIISFIAKYTTNGIPLWGKLIDGSNNNIFNYNSKLCYNRNTNNIYITGLTTTTSTTNTLLYTKVDNLLISTKNLYTNSSIKSQYVLSLNTHGNLIWGKFIEISGIVSINTDSININTDIYSNIYVTAGTNVTGSGNVIYPRNDYIIIDNITKKISDYNINDYIIRFNNSIANVIVNNQDMSGTARVTNRGITINKDNSKLYLIADIGDNNGTDSTVFQGTQNNITVKRVFDGYNHYDVGTIIMKYNNTAPSFFATSQYNYNTQVIDISWQYYNLSLKPNNLVIKYNVVDLSTNNIINTTNKSYSINTIIPSNDTLYRYDIVISNVKNKGINLKANTTVLLPGTNPQLISTITSITPIEANIKFSLNQLLNQYISSITINNSIVIPLQESGIYNINISNGIIIPGVTQIINITPTYNINIIGNTAITFQNPLDFNAPTFNFYTIYSTSVDITFQANYTQYLQDLSIINLPLNSILIKPPIITQFLASNGNLQYTMTISGLTPNTAYNNMQLQSYYIYNNIRSLSLSGFTTLPNLVNNGIVLSSTGITSTTISLSWIDTNRTNGWSVSYQVGYSSTKMTGSVPVSSSLTSILNGVSPSTTYTINVTATYNNTITQTSNTITALTLAIPKIYEPSYGSIMTLSGFTGFSGNGPVSILSNTFFRIPQIYSTYVLKTQNLLYLFGSANANPTPAYDPNILYRNNDSPFSFGVSLVNNNYITNISAKSIDAYTLINKRANISSLPSGTIVKFMVVAIDDSKNATNVPLSISINSTQYQFNGLLGFSQVMEYTIA